MLLKFSPQEKILCQLLQTQHSFCLHLKHVTGKAIQVHDVNPFKEDILVDIMYFIINEVEELLKQFKPKDIYVPREFFYIVYSVLGAHGISDIGYVFDRFIAEASTETE